MIFWIAKVVLTTSWNLQGLKEKNEKQNEINQCKKILDKKRPKSMHKGFIRVFLNLTDRFFNSGMCCGFNLITSARWLLLQFQEIDDGSSSRGS